MQSNKPRFQPCAATGLSGTVEYRAWRTWQQLDQSQWTEHELLDAWQLQRLRQLLKHCVEHVPFYRKHYSGLNGCVDIQSLEDLHRIPLLDRQTYRENADLLVSKSLPSGTKLTGTASTSGTT